MSSIPEAKERDIIRSMVRSAHGYIITEDRVGNLSSPSELPKPDKPRIISEIISPVQVRLMHPYRAFPMDVFHPGTERLLNLHFKEEEEVIPSPNLYIGLQDIATWRHKAHIVSGNTIYAVIPDSEEISFRSEEKLATVVFSVNRLSQQQSLRVTKYALQAVQQYKKKTSINPN